MAGKTVQTQPEPFLRADASEAEVAASLLGFIATTKGTRSQYYAELVENDWMNGTEVSSTRRGLLMDTNYDERNPERSYLVLIECAKDGDVIVPDPRAYVGVEVRNVRGISLWQVN